MKISKETKYIIWLNISYILFITFIYGKWTVPPVVEGQHLTWKHVIEPIFFMLLFPSAYYPIASRILKQGNINKIFIQKKLILPVSSSLHLITNLWSRDTCSRAVNRRSLQLARSPRA